MRLAVAAAGNADENINIINARFQAEALRHIRGHDTGVLVNAFYSSADPTGKTRQQNADFMWKLTASNVNDIAVGRGMATAYGFDIQSEETVHLTAVAPSSGTKYIFVYLEWDFSNPVEAAGSIEIHDNGSSNSWTPPRRDNLITNPIGAYQMVLYRLAVNASGNITAITSWKELGVTSIEWPLHAQYSQESEHAGEADYASGKTDKTIKNHLDAIYERLDALGFKEGAASFEGNGTIEASSLKKQGLFVIFEFSVLFSNQNDITITIPNGFRPQEDATIYILQTCMGGGSITSISWLITTLPASGKITIPYKVDSNGKTRFRIAAHCAVWQIADF